MNECDDDLSDAHLRLVDWNVELLSKLLKNIIASRSKSSRGKKKKKASPSLELKLGHTPFDEWAQAIDLPKSTKENADGSDVELSPKVVMQLRLFVFNIACLHGRNPFHNVRLPKWLALLLLLNVSFLDFVVCSLQIHPDTSTLASFMKTKTIV